MEVGLQLPQKQQKLGVSLCKTSSMDGPEKVHEQGTDETCKKTSLLWNNQWKERHGRLLYICGIHSRYRVVFLLVFTSSLCNLVTNLPKFLKTLWQRYDKLMYLMHGLISWLPGVWSLELLKSYETWQEKSIDASLFR